MSRDLESRCPSFRLLTPGHIQMLWAIIPPKEELWSLQKRRIGVWYVLPTIDSLEKFLKNVHDVPPSVRFALIPYEDSPVPLAQIPEYGQVAFGLGCELENDDQTYVGSGTFWLGNPN